MFGLNPYNQNRSYVPKRGFPQQGRSPFLPFNQSQFYNQRSFQQGQIPFFNNKGGNIGLGNMMNTVGHVMNGYNMLKMLGSISFF